MIFIIMHKRLNMFKTTRIHIVFVAYHLIFKMPENILHKNKLYCNLNSIYYMNHLSGHKNSFQFENDIIINKVIKKVISTRLMRFLNGLKTRMRHFNNIRYHLTLVQIINIAGNVNHAVSINGCWIYDSNLQKSTSFDERIT